MKTVCLSQAKAHPSALIAQAAEGETIRITRRGKPVAQLTGVVTPRAPIDLSALRSLTDSQPRQADSAGDFVRKMRNEDRY